VFTVIGILAGWGLATGGSTTRTTTALIAPTRNAGPAFAAVAIGFGNDPAILAALTGILLVGLAVELPVASWLARRRTAPEDHASEQADAHNVEGTEVGAPGRPRPAQELGKHDASSATRRREPQED
jgi:bile acid:Na+ symporter, BASS family